MAVHTWDGFGRCTSCGYLAQSTGGATSACSAFVSPVDLQAELEAARKEVERLRADVKHLRTDLAVKTEAHSIVSYRLECEREDVRRKDEALKNIEGWAKQVGHSRIAEIARAALSPRSTEGLPLATRYPPHVQPAREPWPAVEVAVDARQDKVHKDLEGSRPGKSAKSTEPVERFRSSLEQTRESAQAVLDAFGKSLASPQNEYFECCTCHRSPICSAHPEGPKAKPPPLGPRMSLTRSGYALPVKEVQTSEGAKLTPDLRKSTEGEG